MHDSFQIGLLLYPQSEGFFVVVSVILSFAKNPGFPPKSLPILFISEKYQKLLLFGLFVLYSVSDLFSKIARLRNDCNFHENFVDRKSKTHKMKRSKLKGVSLLIYDDIRFLLLFALHDISVPREQGVRVSVA